MTTPRLTSLLLFLACSSVLGDETLSLSPSVCVPSSIRAAERSPNGETNGVRYTAAFESYWWNCVMVKATALDARCPSTCSGNEAASQGCADGGVKASSGIDDLLRRFPKQRVVAYLQTLAQDSAGRLKAKRYFTSGPRAEKLPE